MSKTPTYDFGFIKKINQAIFEDFNDLIEAYLSNIQASVFSIANALFEKGFKYFLIKEGKMEEFFPEKDPNLTKMVLSSTFSSSRNFIRSNIVIDYDVVVKVRDYANNKKHDLVQSNPILEKALILTELFSLYVQLNNLYFSPKVGMPDKEYIQYVSSFDKYKEHKLESVDKEIEKRLKEADSEVERRLSSIDEKLALKEKELLESADELEKVTIQKKKAEAELEKAKAEKEALDKYLAERKNEILLSESTTSNNELYEMANRFLMDGDYEGAKRVFESLRNANISDLRAIFGIILCLYQAKNIDELIACAIKTKRSLKKETIYSDIKFLRDSDKQFIVSIADKIDDDIAYLTIISAIENKRYDLAKEAIKEYKANCGNKDTSDLERIAVCEYKYQEAHELYKKGYLMPAESEFRKLKDYKDSSEMAEKIAEERRIIAKKEAEEREKREQARRKNLTSWAESELRNNNFEKAKKYYIELNDSEKVQFCDKCINLENDIQRFKHGRIKKEELNRRVSQYPADVVEIVFKRYKSVDEIEECLKAQEQEAFLQKRFEALMKDSTFESVFELDDVFLKYESLDHKRLSCWSYHTKWDLENHLKLVLSKNPFKIDFIKQVLTIYRIDADGEPDAVYSSTIFEYIKKNISSFNDKELKAIVELDEYEFNLEKEQCDKLGIDIKDLYEDGLYINAYQEIVEAEKKSRKEKKALDKRKNNVLNVREAFGSKDYKLCLSLINNLEYKEDQDELITLKIICHVRNGDVKETLEYFDNEYDKQTVTAELDKIITFSNLPSYINKFRGTPIEKYLIKKYSEKFDNQVNDAFAKGKTAKYFDDKEPIKKQYLNFIQDAVNAPNVKSARKRFEAIVVTIVSAIVVVTYLWAWIRIFSSGAFSFDDGTTWLIIPLICPFGFAFFFGIANLIMTKSRIVNSGKQMFKTIKFEDTKFGYKALELKRCLVFGYFYTDDGTIEPYPKNVTNKENRPDIVSQLLTLFALATIVYSIITIIFW